MRLWDVYMQSTRNQRMEQLEQENDGLSKQLNEMETKSLKLHKDIWCFTNETEERKAETTAIKPFMKT